MTKDTDTVIEDKKDKRWRQGKFHPRNVQKYVGDVNNIWYRSSWELFAFKFLDNNSEILRWCSEGIAIPYQKPIITPNGIIMRPAKYFPDLYVEFKHKNGSIVKELIEIKPLKQTKASKSKKAQVQMHENYVYAVNKCKWGAAEAWCKKYGIGFKLCTEKDLQFMK